MKRLPLTILAALFVFLPAAYSAAQEPGAAETEQVLQSPALSWGQAARFILAAAGDAAGAADLETAFNRAAALAKLPKNAAPGGEATLGGVSLIIMKSFGLSGGLYSLFPGARYACRELVFMGIIQGRSDPGMRLSGERFLRILGRALDYTGADRGGDDA